jgi:bifunctional UDP-N-acetylglucosamine pyrophosphorylase/glucosamine-1-phosphate N-acetyltransferase
MQAVILAAGRGTRMGDLTNHTPKPLLKINGWPILEYTLANLPKEISEVIFVIGYHGQKIKDHFGASRGGKELRYVWQRRLDGTGGALWQIRKLLRGKFLVLNGDDLYHHDDLKRIIRHKLAVLAKDVTTPSEFGVINIDEDGHLVQIVEKPSEPQSNLVNAGVYVLNEKFFDYPLVAISETEFGLPQTIAQMVGQHKIKVERAAFWHPNTKAGDLIKAEEIIEEYFKT